MSGFNDLEAQSNNSDRGTSGDDAIDPLLPKSGRTSSKSIQNLRKSLEYIELDDIPPIIKSANGNVFWADEQCTRRIGLTSSEARLFLKLLQTDVPENFNYEEYKDMFDGFGREQQRLQELADALPWYKFDTYRQRSIWKARIQWLKRMEEPRLWLLYLMARRRRILKQASVRVLNRLKEKRLIRIANGSPTRGRPVEPNGTAPNGQYREPAMLNGTTQTSDTPNTSPFPPPGLPTHPVMTNDAVQTSETHFKLAARIRDSLSIGKRESRSHSSRGQNCPVFDKPFEATREDIKRQVESIMPHATPYIVIGWFLRSASDPKERILQFERPEELFHKLRHGESDVREWRRFLSLKSLRGFGLYKVGRSSSEH